MRKENAEESGFREDVHAAFCGIPFDAAIAQGEKGVVVADSDIVAGMEARSALADQNGSRGDGLAVIPLDAETLAVAVASVLTGSLTFLMCHDLKWVER